MKLIHLVTYLLLLAADIAAAPYCRIQRYDENDGLTQWHVTQMTQDRQGMMWFATWNGLCRYDGYDFRGFKGHVGDGSGLAADRFRSVWLMDDGNLGCRVDEDLYVFNIRAYTFSPAPKGLKPTMNNARAVKDGRPYRYRAADGMQWTIYSNGNITYTAADGRETPYSGTERMEPARLCLPDRQGNLWVAAVNGLYRLSFVGRVGAVDNMENRAEVRAFLADRRGRLWVATKDDSAVAICDAAGKRLGYLTPGGALSKSFVPFAAPVYCMTQTGDGTVWLGSKPGGLFRLKEKAGAAGYSVERIKGLDGDNVYDVKEDRWGRLWIATLGGGICCVENPSAEQPRVLKPFAGFKGYPPRLARKVRKIHITRDGTLLAAATDALVVARILPGGNAAAMQFRCHTREAGRKDALSCSATMNVAEDSRGRIFVSTESGGVNMVVSRDFTAERLSFRHYGKDNALPTDVALSVTPCGRRLLVVSSNGILLLDPDSGGAVHFGKRDFLYACRFSEAVPLRLPDGRWVFGMQDGIFAVDEKHLAKSRFVPPIAVTGMSVQGKAENTAVNASDTIRLGKDERSLTINFAALDYSPDAEIQYAFALEKGGGDGDTAKWNSLGANRSVTLLDLAPGEYRLLVKSTNADGVWVDNVRRITIVVTPKFSETPVARILLVMVLAAFLGGVAYTFMYIRRIRRQRREALDAYLSLLNAADGNDGAGDRAKEPKRPALSDEDDALMRRISAFVEEHLADAGVGVGDMADAVAMSRSALQRRMKQVVGVSPIDFIREARMKHACHLLRTTAMTVSEVAFACGFSDPKYFSRSFKASTGKSPTEWRG